jgi:hypothetical protein
VISDKGPIFEVERNEPCSCYTWSGRYLMNGLEAVYTYQSQNQPVYGRNKSNFSSCDNRVRHIAVSRGTLYGLGSSELDPPRGQKFFSHLSRSALGPTQLLYNR